jgi:anti-anti-sigma factor
MEITSRPGLEGLELVVAGRLDAYWADHLTSAIDDAIRGGAHRITLDLGQVGYLSSAGIRTLLVAHRELARVGGSLRIERPSEAVRSMLEMAGLLDVLVLRVAPPQPSAAHGRSASVENGALEVWPLTAGATLECRLIGEPERFGDGFAEEHCRTERFPADTFGIGLGAFGGDFADCRARFGELLAAAGAAVYLPTDGTNVPDFLVAAGAGAPEVRLLYGLRCAGTLALHARFEAVGARGIALSALAGAALDLAGGDRVGVVMVAESVGLVGAALRRSPALGDETPDLGFPDVRRWISFTSDRAFPATQVLVVGVAARGSDERGDDAGGGAPAGDPTRAFLRPLGPGVAGHFHAAAFSHRPLPRGPLDLRSTVQGLFETESLRGLLHLLRDDRATGGLGESELHRGALWAAPIARFVADTAPPRGTANAAGAAAARPGARA